MAQAPELFAHARWICADAFIDLEPRPLLRRQLAAATTVPHRDDLLHHVWQVRGAFTLADRPGAARLRISADDQYRLWVNGALLGIGPAPSFPQRYAVNDWDIAHLLRPGRNLIAAQVYYQGLVNRVWVSGDHRQGLIAEVVADGAVVAASGASWRGHASGAFDALGVFGYQTQFRERFDSRLHDPRWRQPEAPERGADDGWSPCAERATDHRFALQGTPALALAERAPRAVRPLPDGGWWLDFGQEIAAALTAAGHGVAGAEIELRFGEELLDDGRVRALMRCNCDYRDTWVLSGSARDVLEQVDYKGFRYCEVLPAAGAAVDVESIRAEVRHHPIDEDAFALATDDARLSSIIAICRHSVVVGAQDSLLDCPTREKGPYLGDLTVSGHARLLVSADAAYLRKAIADFADTAAISPGLISVAPSAFMQEIADQSLQWPSLLWRYYLHTADLEAVRGHAGVLDGFMAWYGRSARADGLLADLVDQWVMVDWPANLRDDYDFPLSDPAQPGIHAALNAHWLATVRDANALAAALGRAPYRDLGALRAAFHAAFFKPALGVVTDTPGSMHASLQANALALWADALPPAAIPSVVAHLARKRLACGVYMAYFLLNGLAKAGAHRLVWELLCAQDQRSWATMVAEGATTCFEAWGKDQKWNTSLCHPWAAAPIPILVEHLVGLSPAEPGWRAISFAPRLPPTLGALELRLRVPVGEVVVSHRAGQTTLRAPAGVPVVRS